MGYTACLVLSFSPCAPTTWLLPKGNPAGLRLSFIFAVKAYRSLRHRLPLTFGYSVSEPQFLRPYRTDTEHSQELELHFIRHAQPSPRILPPPHALGSCSEDLHGMQLHVSAHLHHAHARG